MCNDLTLEVLTEKCKNSKITVTKKESENHVYRLCLHDTDSDYYQNVCIICFEI